jgi:hypothetical protein
MRTLFPYTTLFRSENVERGYISAERNKHGVIRFSITLAGIHRVENMGKQPESTS